MHTDHPEPPHAAVQVRLDGDLYRRLEDWRRAQPKIPHRSVALRELLERGLGERELPHGPDRDQRR